MEEKRSKLIEMERLQAKYMAQLTLQHEQMANLKKAIDNTFVKLDVVNKQILKNNLG